MNCFGDNAVQVQKFLNIMSPIEFKYKINQLVNVQGCAETQPTVIKSGRYINHFNLVEGKRIFETVGCEYQIYYWYESCQDWIEWGWVTEAELDKVNS